MLKKEVIREEEGEGPKRFYVVDPETISRTLIIYKRSFMDDLVDSFTDTWMDMEF
jgi:hypothetical protein